MHLLIIQSPVFLSNKSTVAPGEYLVEDVSGAQLLNLAGGGMMTPLKERRPFDETKDWNGRKLLFMRFGGFGDLILLTPVLREVKRRWPQCTIAVSTMANHYGPVLENLPFVDELIDYPVLREKAETYDSWVFFEKAIENNPLAKKLHMTDLFAQIVGLKPINNGIFKKGQALEDYKPEYRPTAHEIIWAMEQYPRINSQRRVCIQVGASAMCRMYPPQRMQEVAALLQKKGFEVFLMGSPGEVQGKDSPGVRILCNAGLTFRQSCAVIAGSDCVVGADSSLIHIAGALGVPAVGLYGPFPWDLRTKYCPTTFAIQGKGPCSPCFHHANPVTKNHFPPQCPTGSKGYCGVLAGIEPERVVALVEKHARKFEIVKP